MTKELSPCEKDLKQAICGVYSLPEWRAYKESERVRDLAFKALCESPEWKALRVAHMETFHSKEYESCEAAQAAVNTKEYKAYEAAEADVNTLLDDLHESPAYKMHVACMTDRDDLP